MATLSEPLLVKAELDAYIMFQAHQQGHVLVHLPASHHLGKLFAQLHARAQSALRQPYSAPSQSTIMHGYCRMQC